MHETKETKVPWRRAWQPTPGFLPGEAHGQRGLRGCSLYGRKESDTTEATEQTDTNKSECLLCCRHLSKHFPAFLSLNLCINPMRKVMSTLSRWRHWDTEKLNLAEDQTVTDWDINPGWGSVQNLGSWSSPCNGLWINWPASSDTA